MDTVVVKVRVRVDRVRAWKRRPCVGEAALPGCVRRAEAGRVDRASDLEPHGDPDERGAVLLDLRRHSVLGVDRVHGSLRRQRERLLFDRGRGLAQQAEPKEVAGRAGVDGHKYDAREDAELVELPTVVVPGPEGHPVGIQVQRKPAVLAHNVVGLDDRPERVEALDII